MGSFAKKVKGARVFLTSTPLMNQSIEQEEKPTQEQLDPYEEHKARQERMETAFTQAVQSALEDVPEADRPTVQKELEVEKSSLIRAAMEERGPEYLAKRIDWLSSLQSELGAWQRESADVSPALAKELKRFIDARADRFDQEIDERMKQTGQERGPALHDTLENVFQHVQKIGQEIKNEQTQNPMSEKERAGLQQTLREREEQLRFVRTLPPAQRDDFDYAFEYLLDKITELEQRLDPEKPSNLVEIALLNRAEFDELTKMNKSLYPFATEAKRQVEERALAEHEAFMAQRRATQDLARAQRPVESITPAVHQQSEAGSERPWWKIWERKRSNPPVESPRG